jgi:hypothetical protein
MTTPNEFRWDQITGLTEVKKVWITADDGRCWEVVGDDWVPCDPPVFKIWPREEED